MVSNNKSIMSQSEIIQRTAEAIRHGEAVVFPTETVYCIGADVSNRNAVTKVFEAKNRPKYDPLIIYIADKADVNLFVDHVPAKARKLMDHFWPGPLTIILPRKSLCNDTLCAGTVGVALCIPNNPIAIELIRLVGRPVAAASANIWGNVGPTCIQHVHADLGKTVEIFIDNGECPIGIETTIISFLNDEPVSLQPGALPYSQIEEIIGPITIAERKKYMSLYPGMTDNYYSHNAVMLFQDQIDHISNNLCTGLICFQAPVDTHLFDVVEVLSEKGSLEEAAHNLFRAMRRLESLDLDLIVTQRVPNVGIGIAINDRLARACN